LLKRDQLKDIIDLNNSKFW